MILYIVLISYRHSLEVAQVAPASCKPFLIEKVEVLAGNAGKTRVKLVDEIRYEGVPSYHTERTGLAMITMDD